MYYESFKQKEILEEFGFKVKYLDSKECFVKYVEDKQPKEIFLNTFSEEVPYITLEYFQTNVDRFHGNKKGKVIGGTTFDCEWLWEDGLYVKL